jgi:hypothetical protein
MPSALVGRASVVGRAGMIEGRGVLGAVGQGFDTLAKNGIIRLATKDAIAGRLAQYGGYLEAAEGWTLGLPVKVVGFTLNRGGKLIVGTMGIAGNSIVKLAESISKRTGANLDPAFIKSTMKTIGITDAFLGFGYGRQIAGIFGFGKGAKEIGGILEKYGYRDSSRTGVGLVSTLEAIEADTTLTAATRSIAGVGSKFLGPLTSGFYDMAKGSWHGAGVGYGLGFLQDGMRGGIDGMWGGVGMGGAGAIHMSWAQYRSGANTHNGAVAEIRKHAKGTTNEQVVEEIIRGAEFDRDWNRVAMLVGAHRMANGINTKMIIHREGDIAHINGNILKLDQVLDADFNIGGRQYRVRELKAEVERLHRQAEAEAMNDATRDNAAETRRLAGERNAELQLEINNWLSDVRMNGTAEQRLRINTRQNAYNGVFISGGAGNGTIYINADRSGLVGGSGYATNTVAAHEVFHAIQKAIFREQAISHFANTLWGISAEGGKLVLQRGAIDANTLKDFADLYADQLHQGDPAGKQKALDEIQSAWDTINKDTATEQQVSGARDVLNHYAEEFGAYYFESYISRHKADFMFRGGNGSGLRRIMNQVENFIDFQTKLDLNGQGIALRIKDIQESRNGKDAKETIKKLSEVSRLGSRVREKMEELVVRNADGTIAKIKNEALFDALSRKLQRLGADKIALERTLKKSGVGEIFRDKDGNYLVVEAADRMMEDLMKRLSNKGANNAFDLSTVPANELPSILARAGLEHWADSNGRLKSPEVIEKERADRGKRMLEFFKSQNPVVTGIVVTTDKNGNERGTGTITNEGLKILKDSGMLLPSEVIKLAAMRDVINTVNGINPLGGGEVQFIYNGLTHEYIADDGQVDRLRKPKNIVLPTFRSVVPYRMEFVMTSKDRNGNTVAPHFEVMVTAIDMGVVLERAAAEFNNSYTLPSGEVINVADLFGGSMEVLKHHLRRYTENLSEGGLPSADLFGGGEKGAAVRDIMFRVLGAIPKGGFGPNGEALLYNNPIIRPFHAWERGPQFPFTTFRLDLMQDINVTTGNFRFNETTGYPRAAGNYQAPQFGTARVIEKDGQKLSVMEAKFEFDKVRKKDGIVTQSTARYTITSDSKKWTVAANDFDKPYVFSTLAQAKDFIHLDSQRRKLIGANQLPAHLMGGESGIVVANIEGNYLLIDTTKKNRIIAGKRFTGEVQAIIEASKLHNKLLLDNLRASKHPSLRLFEAQMANFERISANSPELLPPRLDMAKDGTPKTEAIKDKDDKEVKYTADDLEVKRGLVKIGATKRVLKFQKVSYSLMEALLGSSHYRMGDAAVDAAAEQVSQHLYDEAILAAKDPDKKKGLGWYRNMVRDGYGIFGSVYGMFAESQGATSARTPVAENFKQAEEALSMFSRGKYNDTLSRIHQQLQALHDKYGRQDPATGISEFEAEAIDLLQQKEAAKRANAANHSEYEWDDIVNFRNLKGEDAIPESVVKDFLEAYAELQNGPRKRLTAEQLSEGLNAAKSKIFRDQANLMLRENGKKYNANTVKVGQVMYNIWHELTEGPKTPNFAGNLAGTTREATIDVWAARTLHRIINQKINGRQIWRLSAGMETGVDYIWHNHGTADMPKWEGGGDFFFGQLAFEKAAAKLRELGGEFAEIQPDDLQALIWFHEKGVWEKNGWTQTIGAEMSSFEGPMGQFSGAKDPARIDDYQNIRRLLAGFAGSYDAVGVTQIRGVPMQVRGSGRRFAFPQEKIEQIGGFVADALGSALRGSNIGQTIGVTGGKSEHSLMFDVIAHRGNLTTLANAHGVLLKQANNEARLLKQYSEQLAAELDFNKRGILENKIKKKTKDFDKAKAAADRAEANLKAEQTDPTIKNQLGILAEYLITQAKNYSQKDVYVAELVGENHPNARPAGDVMFGSHLSQQDALIIAKKLSEAHPYIDGFTLIPDPRNPNAAEISRLTNEHSKLDPNSEQAKSLQKKINSLTRYIGVQAVCTPELTARNREFSKVPEVKEGKRDLLVEADAKWYMAEWQRGLKELIDSNSNINGTQLRLNPFNVSAETVPRGAFDTFNSAEIGRDVPLAARLQRYKNGLERESALSLENERTGDLFTTESTALADNRTTWSPTSTERGVGGGVTDALATDAQGQGAASPKGNLILTAEKATEWIKAKLQNPILKSEGGVVWGDKNYQMTQKRGKDGKLTNVFEVIGAFDRKPEIIVGRKQAEAHLMGRLTGEIAAKGGERIIEVNGEQFKVNEATNPVFATDSAALVNIGVYPDTSNIFKYRPDDSPTVEFHKWNSKTVEEAFPKRRPAGSAPLPYSHRMAKYIQRLNALVSRLSNSSGMASIDFQMDTYGSDTPAGVGYDWGTGHYRTFDIMIKATGIDNHPAFPTGRRSITIGHTDGQVHAVTVKDLQYFLTQTNPSPQPKDAPNRTAEDYGKIGGTVVMEGATYGTVKGLNQLLSDPVMLAEFNAKMAEDIQKNGQIYGAYGEYSYLMSWLSEKQVKLRSEYGDKFQDLDSKGQAYNPDGTEARELQEIKDKRIVITKLVDTLYGSHNFAHLAQVLDIPITIKNLYELAYEIQGAGDAVNAEAGARFKAAGLFSEGSRGLSSYIVNKTGAVFKNRRNTYGEGNTVFRMHDANSTVTRDSAAAIAINQTRVNADIQTFVDPTRNFAASNIGFDRAFNDTGTKGNGSLFSQYAEHHLPKNTNIRYQVDSAGNISVEASNKDTGNSVFSFNISKKNERGEVTISGASVSETPESIAKKRESKWYKEETDSEGVLRFYKSGRKIIIDELAGHPDLKTAVLRETIERLRHTGTKSVFYDGFDSVNIEGFVRDSFGKDPELSQQGWEADESGWNIDKGTKYSPSFVPFERLFDEQGLKSGDQFWSKTAARELAGRYSLDFEQVKDAELREGMTDAPMGANKMNTKDFPMTFITINDSGYRGESAAEFYLMMNREAPEGRPTETSQMAILQMRRKADHITIEPIMGALAEIVERLKMAGVTQLWIPKDGYTAADYRKLTDEVVDVYTKMYEGQYDVEGADRDFVTNVDEHDGLKIVFAGSKHDKPSPLTTKNGPVDVWRIDRKHRYSASNAPDGSFAERMIQTNIEKFGLTRDPYEGGYIIANGSMLDFSGRRDASGFKREGDYFVPSGRKGRDDFVGQRYTDHREVDLPDGAAAPHQDRFSASRYNMVRAMQAAGAIRLSHTVDHTLLDIGLKPTSSQLSVIKDLVRDSNESREITVDLRDTTRPDENGWEREAGLRYPAGTDPMRIIRDINRFYNGQDVKTDFSPSNLGANESMAGAQAKYKDNPYMVTSVYYSNWKKGALKQGESADWWSFWEQNGGTLDELVFVWQMAHDPKTDTSSISMMDLKNMIIRQKNAGNLRYDKMSLKEQNAMDLLLFMDAFSGTTYEKGENPLARQLLDSQVKLDVRNERSSAEANDESHLMSQGGKWFSTTPDFGTMIEEWNHMLYGSMMERAGGDHSRWETLLNPPSFLESRRQTSGSKTNRRFVMGESEAHAEGLSPIPRMAMYKDAPSYIAAMRTAMAERIAFMKTQHEKASKFAKHDMGIDIPADSGQELARDIIRQAAMHTIVEAWLRTLEGTQARDMASMSDSIYVRRARKDLGREPTAADLALGRADPSRFTSDGYPRKNPPWGTANPPINPVGASGYKFSLEGPRTYNDPKGTAWHKDYNFVTIVEFVAGILKSPQTQVYLSDLPAMEKSPLDDVLQHLEQNGQGESQQYATELNGLWKKSVNVFQQLVASVRLYAQVFSSKGNWREKIKRGEADPRVEALNQYAGKPENHKRTLLDDSIKAAFMIRPRSLTTETTTYQRRNHGTTETAVFSSKGLDAVAKALQEVRTKASTVDDQGVIYPSSDTIPHYLEARKHIKDTTDALASMAEDVKKQAALDAEAKVGTKDTEKKTLQLYTPKKPENAVVFVPARKMFWALHSEVEIFHRDGPWDGFGRNLKGKFNATEGNHAVDWNSMDTPAIRDLVALYRRTVSENKTGSIPMIELSRNDMSYGWRGLEHSASLIKDPKGYAVYVRDANHPELQWLKALALHAPNEMVPIQVPKANAAWFKKHFSKDASAPPLKPIQ